MNEEKLKPLKDLKEQFKDIAKIKFKELTKELFASVPSLEALIWTQYTPGFNDGEPCVFMTGELYYVFSENAANVESKDYEAYLEEGESSYGLDENINVPDNEKDNLETFKDSIFDNELFIEALESIFGNDKKIKLLKNGKAIVEDYYEYD